MKKTIFLAAILIAALGFTGCGGSDKNGGSLKIDAKVENGANYNNLVDEVRAVGYINWSGGKEDIIIATAPYKNGGFKITLPKKIDDRLLEYYYDMFSEVPYCTVSNKDVKSTAIEEFQAFKNDSLVGRFYCVYKSPNTTVSCFYLFVDDDCKVSGSFSQTGGDGTIVEFIVDLNLKKGWNTTYYIVIKRVGIATIELTTKKPAFDLVWYFEHGSSSAPSKDAKPFK